MKIIHFGGPGWLVGALLGPVGAVLGFLGAISGRLRRAWGVLGPESQHIANALENNRNINDFRMCSHDSQGPGGVWAV